MHTLDTLLTGDRLTEDTTLTLPFELRKRSRCRVVLDNGDEAGVFLERGTILRNGNLLRSDEGYIVKVQSASEPVATVYCSDMRSLGLLAYHLGNRHVALQIGAYWVRYLHDHVLDEMVAALGYVATPEHAPFEPEAGAYAAAAGHGHSHG